MTDDRDATPATAADDLAALDAHAAQLEASAAPAQHEPPAPTNTAAELEQALQLARMTLAPGMAWWADFGKVWSDKQLADIAQAGGAIMDRHGLSMADMLTRWGPYIMLIAATVPPGLATYTAVRHQLAQQKAKQRQGAPVAEAAPA